MPSPVVSLAQPYRAGIHGCFMGCGGSTEAATPGTQYLESNAPAQGTGKGGKSPCDNPLPLAQKTKKVVDYFKVNVATIKNQRVRRKGDPRSQFPAAEHVGEGTREGYTTTQAVTMVPAISVTQLTTDVQNRNLLRSLCCGYMAVERTGPSSFAPTPVSVRPLNVLNGAEAPYTVLWSAPEDRGDRIASHFADDAAALDMLRSRLVPTEYAGARLRYFAGMAKPVRSIAISKNGKLAAAATRRRAFLPNASSLSNVKSEESASSSNSSRRRAFHLENLELAVRLYNVNTSEHVGYFRDGTDTQCTTHMEFLWDLTDSDILTGTEEGFVRILATGRLNVKAEMSSDSERVTMVAVCPSNSICAVADNANTVCVFSLSTKERTTEFTGHETMVSSVGFHPTRHHFVVSSCMKKVLVWHATSGVTMQEIMLSNVRKAFFGGNLKLYMLLPESLQCWTAGVPLELSVKSDSSSVTESQFTHTWTKIEGRDEPFIESNTLTTENSLAMTKPRRYRDATYLPGHAILLFAADEKMEIISAADGVPLETFRIRGVPMCASAARDVCLIGDSHGNIYALDIALKSRPRNEEATALGASGAAPAPTRTLVGVDLSGEVTHVNIENCQFIDDATAVQCTITGCHFSSSVELRDCTTTDSVVHKGAVVTVHGGSFSGCTVAAEGSLVNGGGGCALSGVVNEG